MFRSTLHLFPTSDHQIKRQRFDALAAAGSDQSSAEIHGIL
jgi:hypothetical protein